MEILESIFRSLFFGHDFSVYVFPVIVSLLTLTWLVLLLVACVNLSEEENAPLWGKVALILLPVLVAGVVAAYVTS